MRYQFDDFELDTERYELRRGGVAQRVEPLVFDLIVFLAANAGRIVGRDEIVDRVWKGRAVSDATISSCIKSARRALGDSGHNSRHIRTIRGRGFEFAGTIAEVTAAPRAESDTVANRTAVPDLGAAAARPVIGVLPFTNLSAEVDE
jgi:DNA-binding winged helix-turn-helix (wHTH) protein